MATHWGYVRNELLRPQYRGVEGRRTALRLISRIQRAMRQTSLVRLGSWRRIFDALDEPPPCDRTGRAALRLLASVTHLVLRVSSHCWRICSDVADAFSDDELRELRPQVEKRKVPGAPKEPVPGVRVPPVPRLRGSARAPVASLEPLWGRRPRHPLARKVAEAIQRTGAVERGTVFFVTGTAAPGRDIALAAQEFAHQFDPADRGAVVVVERGPLGRTHFHSLVLAQDKSQVRTAWERVKTGHAEISAVRPGDYARMRACVSYSFKGGDRRGDVWTAGQLRREDSAVPKAQERPEPAIESVPAKGGQGDAPAAAPLAETDVPGPGRRGPGRRWALMFFVLSLFGWLLTPCRGRPVCSPEGTRLGAGVSGSPEASLRRTNDPGVLTAGLGPRGALQGGEHGSE